MYRTDEEIAGVPEYEKETFWFKYKDDFEEALIHQIVGKVREEYGEDRDETVWASKGKRKTDGYDLTEIQYQAVITKLEVLRESLQKELQACYHAFVQVNNLGLKPLDDEKKLTEQEKEVIERMLWYMMFMEKENIPETDPARLIG